MLERLLRRLLGASQADALIGDLREEAARGPSRRQRNLSLHLEQAVAAGAWVSLLRMQTRGRATLALGVRDSVRSVRRFPGSTALAFGIIALSISAATVTFSVVDTVVLRPLPFPEEDRLVAIYGSTPERPHSRIVSPADYYAWRDGTTAFESLAASDTGLASLRFGSEIDNVGIAATSANLFDVLRAHPVIGRAYGPEHEARGRDAVVVIGYDLWRRRFGGDPDVVGRTLTMDGEAMTILGAGHARPRRPRVHDRPAAGAPARVEMGTLTFSLSC